MVASILRMIVGVINIRTAGYAHNVIKMVNLKMIRSMFCIYKSSYLRGANGKKCVSPTIVFLILLNSVEVWSRKVGDITNLNKPPMVEVVKERS